MSFGSVTKQNFILLLLGAFFEFTACRQEQEPRSLFRTVLETDETINPVNKITFFDASLKPKTVLLNTIQVSNLFLEQQLKVSEKLRQMQPDYVNNIISFDESQKAVDLGMGNVPVFDQGSYGTCVTFATTAILDAILNEGDLISQQCILSLSKELGKNYWSGAQHALQILKPLRENGIVESNQCPSQYPNSDHKVQVSEYLNLSSKNHNVASVVGHFIEPITLDIVREALDKKHRIALGFGLKNDRTSTSVIGFDIQIKGKQTIGGLWACTQAGSLVNYCGLPNAGHEVVIIGYDDKQRLLKIRNSWGDFVGDNGDFYMTYDFFEMMSFNGTEIY